MDKLKKLLKAILGIEPTEAQIQKAQAMPPAEAESLTGALVVLEKYQEELPEDLAEATATIVKASVAGTPAAAEPETLDVEKVGAKLSKATKSDLLKIKNIVDGLLQADTEEAKKYAGLPEDVQKRLRAMDERDRLEKANRETALETENAKLKDTVTSLVARVEKMEKHRVSKASTVDEPEGEEAEEGEPVEKGKDGKPVKPLWPSLANKPLIARSDE